MFDIPFICFLIYTAKPFFNAVVACWYLNFGDASKLYHLASEASSYVDYDVSSDLRDYAIDRIIKLQDIGTLWKLTEKAWTKNTKVILALTKLETDSDKLVKLFDMYSNDSVIDRIVELKKMDSLLKILSRPRMNVSKLEELILQCAGRDAVKLGKIMCSEIGEDTKLETIKVLQRIYATKQLIDAYLYQGYKSQKL